MIQTLVSDWRPRRLHKMRVKRREILDGMKEERKGRKVVELPLRIATTKRALTRTRLGQSERWSVFDAFTLIFGSPLNSFLNRFQFIPCIQIVTVDFSHASFVIQHRALSFDPKCWTLAAAIEMVTIENCGPRSRTQQCVLTVETQTSGSADFSSC